MGTSEKNNEFSGLLKQYDEMKKKHPDAIMLFRVGDFYEMYKKDAVKGAEILDLTLTKRKEGRKNIELAGFPHHALDTYLPKLVRAGCRVAICEVHENPKLKKTPENREAPKAKKTSDESTSEKFEKTHKVQPPESKIIREDINKIPLVDFMTALGHDKPISTNGNVRVYESPYDAKSTISVNVEKNIWKDDSNKILKGNIYDLASNIIGTQNMSQLNQYIMTEMTGFKKKQEAAQQNSDVLSQQTSQRQPQMVTANGDKITHGHAYQGNLNPQNWYFTAKMNGEQLKPQLMKPEDVLAYAKKEKSVQDMIKTYYPTKLMEKLPEEAFKLPKKITGPEGEMEIVKFNVYKEKNPASEDMGKYKFYAQVGEKKMSVLATKEDLSAYFDRTISPEKLVIKNFGERLHLPEAYAKYQLPEGITPKSILISKSPDGAWSVSADMGEKGKTSQARLSYDDGYAFFSSKSATREQLAAKYLSEEMKTLANSQSEKNEKTLKM